MRKILLLFLLTLLSTPVFALDASPEELDYGRRWVLDNFPLKSDTAAVEKPAQSPGIIVIRNHDPLQINGRNGRRMKLADAEYDTGLYAHASSDLYICLPKPGKTFSAIIGVDNNTDTANGGSVVFQVKRDQDVLFKSDVMRGGAKPGLPISVDLAGAKVFHLIVDDAGDGISCDQADWANAAVECTDGTKIVLSELPVLQESAPQDAKPFCPFSFEYNGIASEKFIQSWTREITESTGDDGETVTTLAFTDPAGVLKVECLLTTYPDFPIVRWTLQFKNLSEGETPILSNIRGLDTSLIIPRYAGNGKFVLHHNNGGQCTADCYMPLIDELTDAPMEFSPSGGRGTDGAWPYYNIEMPGNTGSGGWIVVIGWPGQWSLRMNKSAVNAFQVNAGQQTTRFVLRSKETVSSPTMVVMPWLRLSWLDAQNVWRAWFIKYNAPRVNGKVVESFLSGCSSFIYNEMINANTANQIECIQKYLDNGIKLDYWWMDAGWYPCRGSWGRTGTWEVDKDRFPNGFAEIADTFAKEDVKNLVWFEPERTHSGTWLTENHPEWIADGNSGGLLNLGNPEAWKWLVEHIDGLIKANKISFYRQDFNIEPLWAWKKWDSQTKDRDGIAEIRYIEGYLAYWDELLKRNPGLRIDSCASGGRRNDLLTMHRAVPLCRSDYWVGQTPMQTMTAGLTTWIPFHGSNMSESDVYNIRSRFYPYPQQTHNVINPKVDFQTIRDNLKIWRDVFVPLYDKDFYPLTEVTLDEKDWCGWEFVDPKTGTGAIQMFRREKSPYVTGQFKLFGIDESAEYEVSDIDSDETQTYTGRQLRESGVKITITEQRAAVIYTFKKK